jgi:hypothetical protein
LAKGHCTPAVESKSGSAESDRSQSSVSVSVAQSEDLNFLILGGGFFFKVELKKGISLYFTSQLIALAQYDICIVCDDFDAVEISDSRNRWQEMKELVSFAFDLGSNISSAGLGLLFLNRSSPPPRAKHFEEVESFFRGGVVCGCRTCLADSCLQRILLDPFLWCPNFRKRLQKLSPTHNLLVLVALAGTPKNIKAFHKLLAERNAQRIKVCILICSGDSGVFCAVFFLSFSFFSR